MTDRTISITGYREHCNCDHCNRPLRHGIMLSDGRTVGATCFDKKLTAPKVYNGRKYRVGAEHVVTIAKTVQRINPANWSTFGISADTPNFTLA